MAQPKGFSLLELVTVMGIFGLLSLVILAIHQQVAAMDRRTSLQQTILRETRFALEAISNNLRIGTVYYGGWKSSCALSPDAGKPYATRSALFVIDEDNERVKYEWKPKAQCAPESVGGCIIKTFLGSRDNPDNESAILTAPTLDVLGFSARIQPLCDPYKDTCANKRQPMVQLTISVAVPQRGGSSRRELQTTVSSRVYREIEDVCL